MVSRRIECLTFTARLDKVAHEQLLTAWVFLGRITSGKSEGQVVAVKQTRYIDGEVPYPVLRHEACILLKLQGKLTEVERRICAQDRRFTGHRSIPVVYSFGTTLSSQFLAMQRLGWSLEDVFIAHEETLTMRNLGAIALQMVGLSSRG